MSENQNPWMINVWKICDNCDGSGEEPFESGQQTGMSLVGDFQDKQPCHVCMPAEQPFGTPKGQKGIIRKSVTLKDFFSLPRT
jgi:hypothetical protein